MLNGSNCKQWTEDFLAGERHIWGYAGKNGGFDKPAIWCRFRLYHVAAEYQFSASRLGVIDIFKNALEMRFISNRPDLCVGVFWVAKSRWTHDFTESINYFVVDFPLHQQSRAGDTGLAADRKDASRNSVNSQFQVGVREDNLRGFST